MPLDIGPQLGGGVFLMPMLPAAVQRDNAVIGERRAAAERLRARIGLATQYGLPFMFAGSL